MPDRHKYAPLPFRPPEGDRTWLLAYAEKHGLAVNALLALALAEFRAQRDSDPVSVPGQSDTPSA